MNITLLLIAAVLGFVMLAGLGFVFVGADDSSAKAVKRAQTMGGPNKAERTRLARKEAQTVTTEQRRKQIQQVRPTGIFDRHAVF